MTVYNAIPDADINPDKPIKSETGYALRDNPIAIAEGDPTAPSINPAALLIGGKGADGILDNSATLSGLGYFEFLSMSLTAPKTVPCVSIIRIAGNATLSDLLTVSQLSTNATTRAQQRRAVEQALGAISGASGSSSSHGGASIGETSSPTEGISWSLLNRAWVFQRPLIGGDAQPASTTGVGGGAIILIIEGDFDCTGGTIAANGIGSSGGGGGAGSINVICTGTVTNGTFNAIGGSGVGIGGGGGLVQLVAAAFSGTQTLSAAAGSGVGSSSNGYTNKTTLTRDQIRTLLQRM